MIYKAPKSQKESGRIFSCVLSIDWWKFEKLFLRLFSYM